MHRVMFTSRGRPFHSYPVMQYIGLNCGVLAGNAAAKMHGVDSFRFFVATVILLVPALAGARVLFLAMHWNFYREHRSLAWNTQEGGAAQYGGLLLALPISVPLLAALKLDFGSFWDLASITIMVGMAFTRVGCLLNGCCTGRATDSWLGFNLPDSCGRWGKRFPVQLLEAGWAVLVLAAGFAIWPWLHAAGSLFLFTASGYACGRLVFESLREPSGDGRVFTIHHGISVVIIALSIAAITAGVRV